MIDNYSAMLDAILDASVKRVLKLGQLQYALKNVDPAIDVIFDFAEFVPTNFMSYRGVYRWVALGYDKSINGIQVGTLLQEVNNAIGGVFMGYKGGHFEMSEITPIFVANYRETTSTAIMSVEEIDYRLVLHTEYIQF